MKIARIVSNILIVCSVLLLGHSLYLGLQRLIPNKLDFEISEIKAERNGSINQQPVLLSIPSLGIELPVIPAKLAENRWESTSKGVSYLVDSPVPGEVGNSILYGHNWPNILGKLRQIEPGSEIFINLSDGKRIKFVVEYTQDVYPSQSGVLDQTQDKRITLYTCIGFLDSKRFVVTAIHRNYEVTLSL